MNETKNTVSIELTEQEAKYLAEFAAKQYEGADSNLGTRTPIHVVERREQYFSTGAAKSVEEPLDTITTKDRFALVTIHGEEYIITDIRMRMLQPRELFNAQGFPNSYIIDHDASGAAYPKSKQVARCGNAVTPPVPAAMVRANLPEHCTPERRKAV